MNVIDRISGNLKLSHSRAKMLKTFSRETWKELSSVVNVSYDLCNDEEFDLYAATWPEQGSHSNKLLSITSGCTRATNLCKLKDCAEGKYQIKVPLLMVYVDSLIYNDPCSLMFVFSDPSGSMLGFCQNPNGLFGSKTFASFSFNSEQFSSSSPLSKILPGSALLLNEVSIYIHREETGLWSRFLCINKDNVVTVVQPTKDAPGNIAPGDGEME